MRDRLPVINLCVALLSEALCVCAGTSLSAPVPSSFPHPMVRRINRLLAETMHEEGVPVIDACTMFVSSLDLTAGDAYHWTGEGYDHLSELIANSIGLSQ